jgi:tungstate transport system ATP-binding protein
VAETFLSLRDVVVRYGTTTALDIPALDVGAGEVLAIVGANGAGKSTLLRVMAMLQTVDRGVVEFRRLAGLYRNSLSLRRRIATVFQQPLLIDDSVYGNVALGLRLRGVGKAEITRRVMPWLERLAIGHLAERSARTLSGGEAQRASLARALVVEPDLLLLDEPFAALDPTSREALLRDFHRTVTGTAITVVFVTHDRHEAYALGQRTAVLDRGRLMQLGSRQEVFNSPVNDLVAATVGFENRLTGIVEAADGTSATVAIGALSMMVSGNFPVGSRVNLCIRANAVRVTPDFSGPENPFRFGGKIREIFSAREHHRMVIDCPGFELVGSVERARGQFCGLSEGTAVSVSLDPSAIHVILAGRSL